MQRRNMDPRQRKQARYAEKKRRKQRHRQILLGILLTGLGLAAAGGLWFLEQRQGDPLETTIPSHQQTQPLTDTQPQQTQPDKPQAGSTVIHVSVAGDLNVTDGVLENAVREDAYDFSQTFQDVAPLISGADLALLNFEGNLSGGSYGTATGAAPLELAKAVKAIGVDAVQTANSAAIRQGVSGLVATLEAFDRVGLTPLGTYANADDFKRSGGYEIVEVEGIRIALIAFTKGMDNLGLPAGSESCVNLLYKDYSSDYKKVDTDRIARILRNVQEEQPDLTIAMVHWGSEYNDEISGSQKKIKNQLLEGGVDIIVGTHPHMVQAIEHDPVGKTLVAWSLGDFFGDGIMAGTNYSILLDLEITKDNATGETFLSAYEYIPIFTLKPDQSAAGGHRVVRIREAMERYEQNFVGCITKKAYDDMAYALTRIEDRVNPQKQENNS